MRLDFFVKFGCEGTYNEAAEHYRLALNILRVTDRWPKLWSYQLLRLKLRYAIRKVCDKIATENPKEKSKDGNKRKFPRISI